MISIVRLRGIFMGEDPRIYVTPHSLREGKSSNFNELSQARLPKVGQENNFHVILIPSLQDNYLDTHMPW